MATFGIPLDLGQLIHSSCLKCGGKTTKFKKQFYMCMRCGYRTDRMTKEEIEWLTMKVYEMLNGR